MAAGKINIQANDGKIYSLTPEEGASGNVALTLPKEGGKVVVASSLQAQLDGKQNTLISGTSIKTINSTSLLGSGNIAITETEWTANDSRAKIALNASGEAPIYACRAWVNFNGTGTVVIRASGNVSSITDNGTGDYTVNFTTAMPDAYYELNGTCGGAVAGVYSINPNILTASSSRIQTRYTPNYTNTDLEIVNISVVR